MLARFVEFPFPLCIYKKITKWRLFRVSTLVKMAATSTSNGIAHSGHRYAMSCAAAAVNPVSALSEIYSGNYLTCWLRGLSFQKSTWFFMVEETAIFKFFYPKLHLFSPINYLLSPCEPLQKYLTSGENKLFSNVERGKWYFKKIFTPVKT